jgi:hypothetical protein
MSLVRDNGNEEEAEEKEHDEQGKGPLSHVLWYRLTCYTLLPLLTFRIIISHLFSLATLIPTRSAGVSQSKASCVG